jgi:hypothetical protein
VVAARSQSAIREGGFMTRFIRILLAPAVFVAVSIALYV